MDSAGNLVGRVPSLGVPMALSNRFFVLPLAIPRRAGIRAAKERLALPMRSVRGKIIEVSDTIFRLMAHE